jgi:hypothetical protein
MNNNKPAGLLKKIEVLQARNDKDRNLTNPEAEFCKSLRLHYQRNNKKYITVMVLALATSHAMEIQFLW